MLRSALKQINKEAKVQPRSATEGSLDLVSEVAMKEAIKTPDQIYDEVVIDEINEELLKSAQKSDGDVIVMLMRQERLKSFEQLWK